MLVFRFEQILLQKLHCSFCLFVADFEQNLSHNSISEYFLLVYGNVITAHGVKCVLILVLVL